MIAQLLAVAACVVIGAAAARKFRGLWYLYGLGIASIALQWLPWSRLTIGALVAIAIVVVLVERRRLGGAFWGRASEAAALHWVDAITLAVLVVYASFATITELWEWDAWAIWALKARVFFEHGGVSWAFLESPVNDFSHPDYPLLVPSALGMPAIIGGAWDDRWIGLAGVAALASAVLAVRQLVSPIAALAVAAIGASRYVATAETFFIAYAVTALACVRAGLWRHAAVLLGFAALTKNEGVALLIAVAIVKWRDARKLWPAALIACSWLIVRAIRQFPTDITSGPILERAMSHLDEIQRIAGGVVTNTSLPFLWIALLIAVPFALRRERSLLLIAAVQMALMIAAYFITPYDVEWHIANSWDRLSRQLAAMLALAVMSALAVKSDEDRALG